MIVVAHKEFSTLDLFSLYGGIAVIYDAKGILSKDQVSGRL